MPKPVPTRPVAKVPQPRKVNTLTPLLPDPERKRLFLERLIKVPNMGECARAVGLNSTKLRQWRTDDPEFNEACNEVWQSHVDRLEQVAMERAIDGWQEPIYYRGVKVGEKTVYSPNLMMKMLEANRREIYGNQATGKDDPHELVRQVQAAISAQDELAMKALGQLPPPKVVAESPEKSRPAED